jgi:hypothetical protein
VKGKGLADDERDAASADVACERSGRRFMRSVVCECVSDGCLFLKSGQPGRSDAQVQKKVVIQGSSHPNL